MLSFHHFNLFQMQSKKSLKAGGIRRARNQGLAAVYLCISAMLGFMFTAIFFTAMLPAIADPDEYS